MPSQIWFILASCMIASFFISLPALPDSSDKSSGKLKMQPRGSGSHFPKTTNFKDWWKESSLSHRWLFSSPSVFHFSFLFQDNILSIVVFSAQTPGSSGTFSATWLEFAFYPLGTLILDPCKLCFSLQLPFYAFLTDLVNYLLCGLNCGYVRWKTIFL